MADFDRGARRLDPLQHLPLRREFGRCRDRELEVELAGGVHPRRQHVVGVAGPRHLAPADRPAMLLEGHDVGHDLAGMRAPRQPVDDRHGGMLRKLEQHVVLEGADHDGVDIARQHAGGVGDGLAAAELHLLAGEHDGVAAELAHGDVERDAGAGRRLVEDHRQHLAGDRAARRDRAMCDFMARLASMMPRSSPGAMSMRSRKWRGSAIMASPPRPRRVRAGCARPASRRRRCGRSPPRSRPRR